jgi:hypothetical protein
MITQELNVFWKPSTKTWRYTEVSQPIWAEQMMLI